jgi:hypothetical protein
MYVLGSAGWQPAGLGSLPGAGRWHRLKIARPKMLPAGLPPTTRWQAVPPRVRAVRRLSGCFILIRAHLDDRPLDAQHRYVHFAVEGKRDHGAC